MGGTRLNNVQRIALGYLLLILLGALLLQLPVATRAGLATDFSTALFTATSAACVTGLAVVDTAAHWSPFGQLVLLLLIQVGGLGFFTLSLYLSLLLRRRVGLGRRQQVLESLNFDRFGGLGILTRRVMGVTLTAEGLGALALALRFAPQYGWGKGLWLGLFHAVSAFCNAGFDLLGTSFSAYAGDGWVNAVLAALIIAGGLGFPVWDDWGRRGWRLQRYSLHSKLTLATTAALLLLGMVGLFLLEPGGGRTVGQRGLEAAFGSVTARTAGFYTVETATLTPGSRLLTLLLMTIGGSPGSTAGGIKTTTAAVLGFHLLAELRRERQIHVFSRRIDSGAVGKASFVALIGSLLVFTGTLLLCALDFGLEESLFECVSAMGTVGMSVGLTPRLDAGGRWVVMTLMFCGRVGGASFGAALMEKKKHPPVGYPTERVLIG